MTTTKPSRLAREIAEMADAQRRLGIVDEAAYAKITVYKSEALKAALNKGEASGEPEPFDNEAFKAEMRAEHGS